MHRIYLPDRCTYGQFTFMCFRGMLTAVGVSATRAPCWGRGARAGRWKNRGRLPYARRPAPRPRDDDPHGGRTGRATSRIVQQRGLGDTEHEPRASGQGRFRGPHWTHAGRAQLTYSPGPASARRPVLGWQATNSLTRASAPSPREQGSRPAGEF